MGISNYNTTKVDAGIDTTNFQFVTLEKLYDPTTEQTYKVHDLYINTKSKFGPAPVAVIDGYKVNLPNHLTKQVREMLADTEVILQINQGHAAFSIREYEAHGRKCYTVTWKDI